MAVHAVDCSGMKYCLCDIPRYRLGIFLCALAALLEVLARFLSGGSISALALMLHALADGGAYGLNIYAARRSATDQESGHAWERRVAWANAMIMFSFAYHIGSETIQRLEGQQTGLHGGWIVFAGVAQALINLAQYAVVQQGDAHSMNRTLNWHNIADITEGLVVAITGAAIFGTGVASLDLFASGVLSAWFAVLGAIIVLSHHHH